jgi:hypothetical protein
MAASVYHRLLRTCCNAQVGGFGRSLEPPQRRSQYRSGGGQAGFRSRLGGLSKMISAVFHEAAFLV